MSSLPFFTFKAASMADQGRQSREGKKRGGASPMLGGSIVLSERECCHLVPIFIELNIYFNSVSIHQS